MKKKAQYKHKPTRKILIAGIAVAAVIAIGAAVVYFGKGAMNPGPTNPSRYETKVSMEEMRAVLDIGTIYNGIFINGQDVSGKTVDEVVAMFDDDPGMNNQPINITLSVTGTVYSLDTAGLKLESNIREIAEEAYQYGREASGATEEEKLGLRYEQVIALKTDPKYFQTAITLSKDKVSKLVHEVLDPLNTELKEAVVTGFDVVNKVFVIEDSQYEMHIDIERVIDDIKEGLDAGVYTEMYYVSASTVSPTVTKEFLESHLGLVSTTKTSTSKDRNRNTNIRLVCETVNGLVLQPGESFNYNSFVGERTAAKGYKEAGGIYDGRTRDELGGGICQVSGTMYHSVMKADLQVDLRYPHSWPSTYVQTGTDATVTWGGANFQFTNNTDYPIAMIAEYRDKDNGNGGWCTIEIYGRPIPDGMTIEFVGVVHSSRAPTKVEYVADPLLDVGKTETEREPHNAISASAYQVFYRDGEEVKRVKASSSNYRMINALIRVGVKGEDGTIYTIDPLTGAVVMTPTPTPPGPTDPTGPTGPTDPTEPPPTTVPPDPTDPPDPTTVP